MLSSGCANAAATEVAAASPLESSKFRATSESLRSTRDSEDGQIEMALSDTGGMQIKLPSDLYIWRLSIRDQDIPNGLAAILNSKGYTAWSKPDPRMPGVFGPTDREPASTGFAYVTPSRGTAMSISGYVKGLSAWYLRTTLAFAARSSEGHDVVAKVVAIREQGQEHLRILRKIARDDYSFFSNNHTLPLFEEIAYGDIVLGVFPKVGFCVDRAYGRWAENSVGDILNMILQALEGVAFLHEHGIAHRDIHKANMLVQWFPESLRTKTVPTSRPRVYLIDFEVAVEFPLDCPPADRVSVGLPLGVSIADAQKYARNVPPEVTSGRPYDPFKLDVWHLGESFSDFESTIKSIDEFLLSLAHFDPEIRPTASQAHDTLSDLVNSLPPKSLLISPIAYDRATSEARIGIRRHGYDPNILPSPVHGPQ